MSHKKIDSNIVGLHYAEEVDLKVLPDLSGGTVGDQAGGRWFPLEPNEYDDFGGEVMTVTREPINASRQNKKGTVTDIEASGGFQQDLTQRNLQRLMQGFMFADAHERPNTDPINNKSASLVELVNLTTGATLTVATGHGSKFIVGMILKLSGMGIASNNKAEIIITGITGDVLTTNRTFLAETVTAVSSLEIVGYRFLEGIAAIDYTGGTCTLTRSSGSFVDLDLNVGEWIFIGGDATPSQFITNEPGFARIRSISADALTLEELTFVPITEAGGVLLIQIYFGTFIRNEKDIDLIKRRSYQIERTLGQDDDGVQSEYLVGAVSNELTITLPSTDKIVSELSFVAMDNELRTGTDGLKAGSRTDDLIDEDAINTSSDVYQLRLFVHDSTNPTPSSLFAVVLEGEVVINNNVTGLKGIGQIGSFETNVGNFTVSGEMEVYFATVTAIRAVRRNEDVGFNLIVSRNNEGFVYDIPLVTLSGGLANVEKDEPIMLSLEKMAVESAYGYTMSATYFGYLPNIAMADQS